MSKTREPPKKGEVPFVIKQAGKALDDDIKPTLHVLGQILFSSWPEPPRPRRSTPPAEAQKPKTSSKPLRLGAGHQIVVVSEDGHERDARRRPRATSTAAAARAKAAIPDAEIIEEAAEGATISSICSTCGGAGKLGMLGHEVPCPVCSHR
jgi:hypothetical protein